MGRSRHRLSLRHRGSAGGPAHGRRRLVGDVEAGIALEAELPPGSSVVLYQRKQSGPSESSEPEPIPSTTRAT